MAAVDVLALCWGRLGLVETLALDMPVSCVYRSIGQVSNTGFRLVRRQSQRTKHRCLLRPIATQNKPTPASRQPGRECLVSLEPPQHIMMHARLLWEPCSANCSFCMISKCRCACGRASTLKTQGRSPHGQFETRVAVRKGAALI